MWQLILIPLSLALLVSALVPSLREPTRAKKGVAEPKERMKIIYPTALSPTKRK